jgi:hypothetical protein
MHVIHAREDPRLARLPLERGPPACILRREAEIRRLSHQQAIRSGFQSHLTLPLPLPLWERKGVGEKVRGVRRTSPHNVENPYTLTGNSCKIVSVVLVYGQY